MWTSIPEFLDTGPSGRPGQTGGWIFNYKFSTNITAPPEDGHIQLDDIDMSAAGRIFISTFDTNSEDLSGWLNDLEVDDNIKIFSKTDNSIFVSYRIAAIGNSGTDGYFDIAVIYLNSNGSFTDNGNIIVTSGKIGSRGEATVGGVSDDYDDATTVDSGTTTTDGQIASAQGGFILSESSSVIITGCAQYVTAPPGVTTEFYYTLQKSPDPATEYEGVVAFSTGSFTISVPGVFIRRHFLATGAWEYKLYKRGTAGGGSITGPCTLTAQVHDGVDI